MESHSNSFVAENILKDELLQKKIRFKNTRKDMLSRYDSSIINFKKQKMLKDIINSGNKLNFSLPDQKTFFQQNDINNNNIYEKKILRRNESEPHYHYIKRYINIHSLRILHAKMNEHKNKNWNNRPIKLLKNVLVNKENQKIMNNSIYIINGKTKVSSCLILI